MITRNLSGEIASPFILAGHGLWHVYVIKASGAKEMAGLFTFDEMTDILGSWVMDIETGEVSSYG